ncbi:hypothetical protein, conserved [Leishmania donovani]|uniref:CYTH domain-containing protein n=1 Tax=Leishmania donovani TaxID=5661 RepID=A0A3S7WVE7_LEIDO|nr:hypothetical protein, conserved [Leishmania donovani]AYU78160.1 hypothetical protein LdCL_190011200 [Leishmania donovani]TPP51005.1 hypothetical protein CGC21_19280 [Leishmania donovani]CBZ33533.1 hypothetical protein, conserved [Leishmania donovani]
MQIEVKLSLEDAESYQRTLNTLANHHLKDECYYDLFFDFPYPALQERSSVLRLRVPCDPASVYARSAASAPSASAGGNGNYDPEAEYEALLRACRGEVPPGFGAAAGSSTFGCAHAATVIPQTGGSGRSDHGLPLPIFIPGAAGKLILKQKNTVEHGHQMSFVVEDAQVPAAVVEALVRLVPDSLFTTGVVPASTATDGGASNIFTVLSAYAQQRPHSDDGAGDSAIVRILSHLSAIARAYAPSNDAGASAADPDSSDAHFTQVRFAAMGTHTAYTQQQLATSQRTLSKEGGKLEDGGGAGAVAVVPQLEAVAGFMTLRKVFSYAPLIALQQGLVTALELTESEREFREGLRVRVDASYLLPGLTIYELEVPKCGVAVDDVATEVGNFLRQLAVPFHMGSESKFSRYTQYLAATREAERDANDVKLRLTNVNGYEEVRRNLQQLLVSTSTATAQSSQDRRHLSNTEVNPVEGEEAGADDTWWHTNPNGYLQETNEDFFFDSPEQTLRRGKSFLRLRKQLHSNKYLLTLKAHQVFSGGQQNSLSSKVDVSEVVARALIDNPTQFLHEYAERFAVVKTMWKEFGVRELCRTATFTTERLTVPWWAAQAQQSTLQRSWAAGTASALAKQSQPTYTSTSYYLSQQEQQHRGYGTAGKLPPVPPLIIHLDRTLYKLPADAQAPRIPFTQCRSRGDRQCETYEIEVTNIVAPTEPKDVVAELTTVLNGLGVEWTVGVRSKLEQYFSLMDM